MQKRIARTIKLWFVMGIIYYAIEGIWHLPMNSSANIVMLFVGGIGGISIDYINRLSQKYKIKMIYQTLFGVLALISVEFISGCIINLYFRMNLWNYKQFRFNFMGQICLEYCLIWIIITPISIWLVDYIKFILFKEESKYKLTKIYKNIFFYK